MNLKKLEKYKDHDLEARLGMLVLPGESFSAGMFGKVGFTVTIDLSGAWMVTLSKEKGAVTQRDARMFFDMIGEDHKRNEIKVSNPMFRRWIKE